MNNIAIDLGGRESQACVLTADGTRLEELRQPTLKYPAWFKTQPKSVVVMETCAECWSIADAAREAGHEVRVVPSSLVKALGVGARKTKNDRMDARRLGEASCRMPNLPTVHVPSKLSRELKTKCGAREVMVRSRTALINNVRGWMRGQLLRMRKGEASTFPKRVREKMGTQIPSDMERLLELLDELTKRIKAADKELEQFVKENQICRRLMTVPGVGPVTAVRLLAQVDEIKRFEDAHQLEAYLGLTPGDNSSGDRHRSTSITKAGPTQLRWTLVQAAWSARRHRGRDPMVLWSLQVEHRRGRRVAVVALARKLAGILFAVWRDEKNYDPKRGANLPPADEAA